MSVRVLRTVLVSQEQNLGGDNVGKNDVALGLTYLIYSSLCHVTLNAVLVK